MVWPKAPTGAALEGPKAVPQPTVVRATRDAAEINMESWFFSEHTGDMVRGLQGGWTEILGDPAALAETLVIPIVHLLMRLLSKGRSEREIVSGLHQQQFSKV